MAKTSRKMEVIDNIEQLTAGLSSQLRSDLRLMQLESLVELEQLIRVAREDHSDDDIGLLDSGDYYDIGGEG
jgi:hypothetical protein